MGTEELITYWRNGSVEDIETAEILLEKRKFRECLFFVHLALEKSLKARVVAVTQTHAPKIHNLDRLAALADIEMPDESRERLSQFNRYCMQGRYPDLAPVVISAVEARERFLLGKEFLQWLLQ